MTHSPPTHRSLLKPANIVGIGLLLILLLIAGLSLAVSFITSVAINAGQTTFTDQNLVCTWNYSGDTTSQNITWLRNGGINFSYLENPPVNTNNTVGSGNTTRGEVWQCIVTLFNATANVTGSANLTIENQAPNTPTVYNATGQDIDGNINITEDIATILDMNSSDIDNDVLTFFFLDGQFCNVTNSATGAVSCLADHSRISNGSGTESATLYQIEFWVRDTPPNTKSSSKTVNITVLPVNDVPILVISTQQVNVTETLNQTFNATDEEEDYVLTAVLNTSLTSANISDDVTVVVEGNRTVRVVYETNPTEFGDAGNHTVVINLTDARNATVLVNFTLEILPVNQNPFFTGFSPSNYSSSQNLTYVLYQSESIIINITANDPDTVDRNETLSFSDNTSIFVTQTITPTATNVSDALGLINFTATNDDVGNHTVLVTVTDQGSASNSSILNFTILNVNDPPVINNQSFDPGNTGGNVNITPLLAYLAAPFSYQVNFTDPDLIHGDILSWADNTSTINISSGGLIAFTPSTGIGNETINISVTDANGSSAWRSVILEILNNTAPYFNASFPLLACSEKQQCFLNVSNLSADDDPGDFIQTFTASFISGNASSFSLNSGTGIIDFTPLQGEIGNYTLNITITDTRGASAWQLLNLTINNTEDVPIWLQYNFSSFTIVEDHEFTFQLQASDDDFLLNLSENLTFTTNATYMGIVFQGVVNDTALALLTFTPNASLIGNQSIQLNVTDSIGQTNSTNFTIQILADTDPPTVEFIQPYGGANDTLIQDYLNVSGFPTPEENVTLLENTSNVLFEVNATDDVTPVSQLGYLWYYDGVLNSSGTGASAKTLTLNFSFFSSGSHNVTVYVNDTTLENVSWTWNVNVLDVNRPIVLVTNLTDNLTIDSTTSYPNYFIQFNGQHYYDPDDDLDENGLIDGNESLTATITSNPQCTVADVEVTGHNLRLVPTAIGSCIIQFNATDAGGVTVGSNLVTIDVTEVPEAVSVSSSSGGGGSSTRQTEVVPIRLDVEVPQPLTLVTPQLVTIYRNRTVRVPIRLENNWTDALEGIILGAETNNSDVVMQFDDSYIERLEVGESREITMTVGGYRLGENFEILVSANVTTPTFHDEALILLNSIEQAADGESVEVKVTFAQDLLSQNEECQELEEILQLAEARLLAGAFEEAAALVDSVINGCKYMMSKTQPTEQRPGILRTPYFDLGTELPLVSYIVLGVFLIGGVAGLAYYHFKTRKEYDF